MQKCIFSHSGIWKSEMGRFDLFWGLSPWLAEGRHADVLTRSRLCLSLCCKSLLLQHQSFWTRAHLSRPQGPHCVFVTSLKAMSSNIITSWGTGVRTSTQEFWKDIVQPVTMVFLHEISSRTGVPNLWTVDWYLLSSQWQH